MGFPSEKVLTFPGDAEADSWMEAFFTNGFGRRLSHLIAIERVGPSHTVESLRKQTDDSAIIEAFLAEVPPESRGHCHNMRGEILDEWTGGVHRLFDWVETHCPGVRTIGIADGGNEIGMGCLRWDDIARRLLGPHAARIPCRVATTWNIIAGISNWGGYALAAGVMTLRDQTDVIAPWTSEREQQVLEHLVTQGPAVDGVTRLPEPTVDGLPFLTYIQTWSAIRRRLGYED